MRALEVLAMCVTPSCRWASFVDESQAALARFFELLRKI